MSSENKGKTRLIIITIVTAFFFITTLFVTAVSFNRVEGKMRKFYENFSTTGRHVENKDFKAACEHMDFANKNSLLIFGKNTDNAFTFEGIHSPISEEDLLAIPSTDKSKSPKFDPFQSYTPLFHYDLSLQCLKAFENIDNAGFLARLSSSVYFGDSAHIRALFDLISQIVTKACKEDKTSKKVVIFRKEQSIGLIAFEKLENNTFNYFARQFGLTKASSDKTKFSLTPVSVLEHLIHKLLIPTATPASPENVAAKGPPSNPQSQEKPKETNTQLSPALPEHSEEHLSPIVDLTEQNEDIASSDYESFEGVDNSDVPSAAQKVSGGDAPAEGATSAVPPPAEKVSGGDAPAEGATSEKLQEKGPASNDQPATAKTTSEAPPAGVAASDIAQGSPSPGTATSTPIVTGDTTNAKPDSPSTGKATPDPQSGATSSGTGTSSPTTATATTSTPPPAGAALPTSAGTTGVKHDASAETTTSTPPPAGAALPTDSDTTDSHLTSEEESTSPHPSAGVPVPDSTSTGQKSGDSNLKPSSPSLTPKGSPTSSPRTKRTTKVRKGSQGNLPISPVTE